MPPPRDLETFEAEFRTAVDAVLLAGEVRVVHRTLVAIKLRVELNPDRFVDAFFNRHNGRTDLSVVEGDRRIFGYDNLGGWHRHPEANPEEHESCEQPTLERFLTEVTRLAK